MAFTHRMATPPGPWGGRGVRAALPAALLALSSGCALAPGMKMDEGAAVRRGRSATGDEAFRVEPITPGLIATLASEGGQPPRPTDPLGGQPPPAYTIAPHDVLQVLVWDHPELTTPTGQFRSPEENGNTVAVDGTVYYPHVGVLAVAGKTVTQVRSLLTDRLSRYIQNPQLDVRVVGFHGRKVQVTGEVIAPGAVPITQVPLRVQDALAAVRGLTPEADAARVQLLRGQQVYPLDVQALLEVGDLSQDWVLQDGDVLQVPDRSRNRVFVMGEVKQQQTRLMARGRMTLAEALGEAGGMDLTTASAGKVYVLRGDFAAPRIYRLDAGSPDALLLAVRFPLRPLDVVFVSATELTRWNRVITQILPTLQALYPPAITADVLRRYR